MKNIIGISGLAGSGKDTAAKFIVKEYGFAKIALADPMKRFCKEIYKFTDEQLWGESEMRNKPDMRLPKTGRQARYARELYSAIKAGVLPVSAGLPLSQLACDGWLSPRELLQKIAGTWGRNYEDVWIKYGLDIIEKLLSPPDKEQRVWQYKNPAKGLYRAHIYTEPKPSGVIVSDCRYINELNEIKLVGGKVIRILGGTGLKGDFAKHLSETEQKYISDDVFDAVIKNDGTIKDLEEKIKKICDEFFG